MKFNEIVFDVETKKAFSDVGGRTNPERLGVSVVGAYFYKDDSFHSFAENELKYFFEEMASAERIIGFNINNFDLPVLQPYASFDLKSLPALDLLEDLAKTLGYRVSLNSLSQATLGAGKSGDGLNAIKLYREGKTDELKSYCLQDVKLTRDLYEFAKKENKLYFLSPLGQKKEVAFFAREPISREISGTFDFQSALF